VCLSYSFSHLGIRSDIPLKAFRPFIVAINLVVFLPIPWSQPARPHPIGSNSAKWYNIDYHPQFLPQCIDLNESIFGNNSHPPHQQSADSNVSMTIIYSMKSIRRRITIENRSVSTISAVPQPFAANCGRIE